MQLQRVGSPPGGWAVEASLRDVFDACDCGAVHGFVVHARRRQQPWAQVVHATWGTNDLPEAGENPSG